ncbi:Pepco domain-containing protein [Streptomyces sp. cg35]|uniref:Pepco domain-containing protein n=1 Tax=Streptomyces sp. cg35 TaxID=3421650 RepID=UPI003D16A52C
MTERVGMSADPIEGIVEEQTLPFWVSVTDDDDDAAGPVSDSMGLLSRDHDAALRAIPLGPLRKNLTDVVDKLQEVFKEVAEHSTTLPLAEAQLSFQVSKSGSVQLIGTGQVQATRGLTLTFKIPS